VVYDVKQKLIVSSNNNAVNFGAVPLFCSVGCFLGFEASGEQGMEEGFAPFADCYTKPDKNNSQFEP
jgi:hypothetical protein